MFVDWSIDLFLLKRQIHSDNFPYLDKKLT